MVWWCLAAGWIAAAAVALRWSAAAHRWTWRERSLEARLRDSEVRREAFERTLARLRRDREQGRLTINDDYRGLFDRLTADARGDE